MNNEKTTNNNEKMSKKEIIIRLVLFIVFFTIGITAVAISIAKANRKDYGWTVVNSREDKNTLANEIQFSIYLNEENKKQNSELFKEVRDSYTVMCQREFELFDPINTYEDVKNIAYINTHINEKIQVHNVLYKALKSFKDNNFDYLYYGPIISVYDGIFMAGSEADAKAYDPKFVPEYASDFETIANYVKTNAIHFEFYENDTIELVVSDEYKAFVEQYEYYPYVDFGFTKYGLLVDSIDELMRANNINNYVISSIYGFFKANLKDQSLLYSLYDLEGYINEVGMITLNQDITIFNYRTYPRYSSELDYIVYQDNTPVHHFIDLNNGKYENMDDTVYVYAKNESCISLLAKTYDTFINPSAALNEFVKEEIHYIGFEEFKVITDEDLEIKFIESEDYKYKK